MTARIIYAKIGAEKFIIRNVYIRNKYKKLFPFLFLLKVHPVRPPLNKNKRIIYNQKYTTKNICLQSSYLAYIQSLCGQKRL